MIEFCYKAEFRAKKVKKIKKPKELHFQQTL